MLWSLIDFESQKLQDCLRILHSQIVGLWNFPDRSQVRFSLIIHYFHSLRVFRLHSICQATNSRARCRTWLRTLRIYLLRLRGEHRLYEVRTNIRTSKLAALCPTSTKPRESVVCTRSFWLIYLISPQPKKYPLCNGVHD